MQEKLGNTLPRIEPNWLHPLMTHKPLTSAGNIIYAVAKPMKANLNHIILTTYGFYPSCLTLVCTSLFTFTHDFSTSLLNLKLLC